MRFGLALICFATPAFAWDFTPGLPCVLTHDSAQVAVTLTHDPTQPLFSITLTRDVPWPRGPVFSIQFQGAASLTISTTRHQISPDGRTLTVTDTGFGNVLDGLAFNQTAYARIGDLSVPFDLDGARAPVSDFRDCALDPSV